MSLAKKQSGRTIIALWIALSGSGALAHCDPANLDTTPPREVSSTVDDGVLLFDWGTDVNDDYGVHWLTNFIRNSHETKGWSGLWAKGDIEVAVSKPLPAGKVLCRQSPLDDCATRLDTDAPIVYGSSNSHQRAAVYVADCSKPTSSTGLATELTSSYLDKEGKSVDVQLNISFIKKEENLVELDINFSPADSILGISNVTEAIGQELTNSMLRYLTDAGAEVETGSLVDYAGADSSKEFRDSDFAYKDLFIFFDKSFSVPLKTKSARFNKFISGDLILLTKDHSPILKTKIQIPALE